MPIAGVIGAVGSIASGLLGAGAASHAADAQVRADQAQIDTENRALDLQKSMYDTGQANLTPYLTTGGGALASLAQLYGLPTSAVPGSPSSAATPGTSATSPLGQAAGAPDYSQFFNSPDYAFAFQQGQKALDSSAAAKGLLMSGGQLKSTQEFGQGLASQQYGNYFNRLLGLAQFGQNSASSSATNAINAGSSMANTAGQLGQAQQGQGAAQASGIVGASNALTGGINNAFAAYNFFGNKNGNPASPLGAGLGTASPSSYQYPAVNSGLLR